MAAQHKTFEDLLRATTGQVIRIHTTSSFFIGASSGAVDGSCIKVTHVGCDYLEYEPIDPAPCDETLTDHVIRLCEIINFAVVTHADP